MTETYWVVKKNMKNYFCAWIGGCYSMGQGLKSWLWACGKGFLNIFDVDLDFLGFM